MLNLTVVRAGPMGVQLILNQLPIARIDQESAPFFRIDGQAVVLIESKALGPDSVAH